MAHLRLVLVVLVGACGQAGAQASAATSGITPPTGWQVLAEVARSTGEAAKADGVTVAGSEAWGDTARGCYAVWLKLTGSGVSADQVIAGIASEKLETKDIVKPATGENSDGRGLVSLAFTKPGYTGRLRARIESGGVTALACFANEREQIACETACTNLLGALR
jgi:hypothetical protein